MKVSAIIADMNTVTIALEPEHVSEIALVNLLNGCDAKCRVSGDKGESLDPATVTPLLHVLATVKTGSRY